MTQVCRPLRNVILHDELYIKPHRIRSGERTIIGGEDVTDCHCYCLTSHYSPPTILPFAQRYHVSFALSLSSASLYHSITLYSYSLSNSNATSLSTSEIHPYYSQPRKRSLCFLPSHRLFTLRLPRRVVLVARVTHSCNSLEHSHLESSHSLTVVSSNCFIREPHHRHRHVVRSVSVAARLTSRLTSCFHLPHA